MLARVVSYHHERRILDGLPPFGFLHRQLALSCIIALSLILIVTFLDARTVKSRMSRTRRRLLISQAEPQLRNARAPLCRLIPLPLLGFVHRPLPLFGTASPSLRLVAAINSPCTVNYVYRAELGDGC
jgi:hypothetical protein